MCGNNSIERQERHVSPEKSCKEQHLFLLYQSAVLSVIDYRLGLSTVAQTNLLKLDRTQNEATRVVLRTTKNTPTETILHKVHVRPPNNANQIEGGAGESTIHRWTAARVDSEATEYVTRSHELSLNSQPAYCATGKSSRWWSVWMCSDLYEIRVYKH